MLFRFSRFRQPLLEHPAGGESDFHYFPAPQVMFFSKTSPTTQNDSLLTLTASDSPENQWLEDEICFLGQKAYFQGLLLLDSGRVFYPLLPA